MKLFQRAQRSLFGEILDWMLTPLLILWPISLFLTWLVAQNIAGRPFDQMLAQEVHTLAKYLHPQNGQTQFIPPLPASTLLHTNTGDAPHFQVLGLDRRLLDGSPLFPLPPLPEDDDSAPGTVQWRDARLNIAGNDTDVRIAYMWVAFASGPASDSPQSAQAVRSNRPPLALVQVAETLDKRSHLTAGIIKSAILPQFAVLPIAVLLVWLALAQAIRPLDQLAGRIRARAPDDLSPLDTQTVPEEVAPLVMSINDLLTRLKDSIAVQKHFLADAAHQLKTPLAGLRMQADLAQREGTNTEDLKQSLRQIARASTNAAHTVNQLLALARAEGSTAVAHRPCDLVTITTDAMREVVPLALEKHLDLGYDGASPGTPGVQLEGNPTLLKELVRNLLDNAINYTPSSAAVPGIITARVLADPYGRVLMLQVEDSGNGVPEAERALIFQPFYRALGTQADGSGLGLSIAQEIARQHHAEISVEDLHPGRPLPGARFTVRFSMRGPGLLS